MITVAMGTAELKRSLGRVTTAGGIWPPEGSGGRGSSCRGVAVRGSGGKNPSCWGIATTPDWGPPAAAGAALKLDANMIAATAMKATERVIWSAEARAELFLRFFILFLFAV